MDTRNNHGSNVKSDSPKFKGEVAEDGKMTSTRMYTSSSAPTVNNDESDSAGISQVFEIGDLWHETTFNILYQCSDNSKAAAVWGVYVPTEEIKIEKTFRIVGTGSLAPDVLKVTGTVRILEQYATITSVTTLNNATGVYADTHDGTNVINLTADGSVLSGCPVDSFFTKDKDSSETYSVAKADQVRMNEVSNEDAVGTPFTITNKNNTDTFIRFHLTTTDNPVDFTIKIVFKYNPLSPNSELEFL